MYVILRVIMGIHSSPGSTPQLYYTTPLMIMLHTMVGMVGVMSSPNGGHGWHPKSISQKWSFLTPQNTSQKGSFLTPHSDGTTWVSAGHPTDHSSCCVSRPPPNMGIGWMVIGVPKNGQKWVFFTPPKMTPKTHSRGGGTTFARKALPESHYPSLMDYPPRV